ncbi:MAG: ferrous iron transport protein B [Actinomycetota bacterium]|nr:MAG: ferrous iron transport protein B [Actinomycetota bacterium]
MKGKEIVVALAGNPNSGKTTIFNNLTGLRQHVGNYPGVTVEKRSGEIHYKDYLIKIIDLPGIYSLTAFSEEEIVARNFILEEKPDVVVDVIDSSNLERNLYLTVQLLEIGAPLILDFNMADIARKKGQEVDRELLSELLGAPIVETVGPKGTGTNDILDAAIKVKENREIKKIEISYGEEIENELERIIKSIVNGRAGTVLQSSSRWTAVKLLEQDQEIISRLKKADPDRYSEIEKIVSNSIRHINNILRDSPEVIIADARYGFIKGALREAYEEADTGNIDITEKIDSIITNRFLGIPVFAIIIWLMFQFVFTLGKYPMGWIEYGFGKLSVLLNSIIPGELFRSLIVDGIIGGVGGVVIFTPNIALLFLVIALLEDSGYMARAAFVMDRIMHKIGLHGKSFIPLIIGFGCTIPAYMGSRILENKKDRLITMHINTFSSCGARLPVYILLAGAFFPAIAGNIVFSIYIIGIIFAIIMAKVLRATRFKGEMEPFVMELPPYRIPTLKGIFIHTWERTWMYLKKAGTIILAISILMWFLFTFPILGSGDYSEDFEARVTSLEQSYSSADITEEAYIEGIAEVEGKIAAEKLEFSAAGRTGKFLEPVFRPLGFDWRMVVASISGIAAKEVIVSNFSTLFSLQGADEGSAGLQQKLRDSYDPLKGYTFMLFVLLYFPCMAGMVVFRREAGTKEMFFQMGYTSVLAWVVAFIVYQVGSFFMSL